MYAKKWFGVFVILVLALVVWAVFDLVNYFGGSWQCSQVSCGRVITAEEGVNQNCYVLPQDESQVVCTVNINNTNQLVPLDMIDTSTLNQCIDPICVQEVRTRDVNYTLPLVNSTV